MQKKILELTSLTKKFGSLTAVDKLSLSLEKGHVYGLLGPNGSGKSTTLGMVLNVINPTSGRFQWYNGTVSTHEALKKVGALIERPNFYPYLTAMENLQLICKIKKCSYENIANQLQLVELWERKDSKFRTFSLGMKQRLAIAAALVNQPDLLILDEPTNGLDPEGIHKIRELIKTIASLGTTVLLASHLLDEVEKTCSHVIVLKNGVKHYEGRVDALMHSHGYFELACENNKMLHDFLKDHPDIDTIKKQDGILIGYVKRKLDATDFHKQILKHKITLTHFCKRRLSLEAQFLELTKKKEA